MKRKSDAVTDADHCEDCHLGDCGRGSHAWGRSCPGCTPPEVERLRLAEDLGAKAARVMMGKASETDGYGNTADRLARYAARAAFRACPELRGGR